MWLNHYAVSPYWYHAVPVWLFRYGMWPSSSFAERNALIFSKPQILGFPEMASNDVGQSAVLF